MILLPQYPPMLVKLKSRYAWPGPSLHIHVNRKTAPSLPCSFLHPMSFHTYHTPKLPDSFSPPTKPILTDPGERLERPTPRHRLRGRQGGSGGNVAMYKECDLHLDFAAIFGRFLWSRLVCERVPSVSGSVVCYIELPWGLDGMIFVREVRDHQNKHAHVYRYYKVKIISFC